MNFKEAYQKMLEGKKVRRKIWKAYWHYDKKTERCYSHIDDKYSDREVKEIIFEDSLAEDWEVVEEKRQYWKPKKDEKYYFITAYEYDVCVIDDMNDEVIVDDNRINMGNCFKTEEEAEHMVEKLKVIHELQKFAYENNEIEIDWNDGTQQKHFIFYDHNKHEVDVTCRWVNQFLPFNIYFAPQEIALKAIETIGADRIKKYYFDVDE